ncbi:MAG: hypothetical protein KGI67_10075 [Pseudomonadota bacterium]|nr:hypothetical protein [Pseudomonadota bacterium]
MNRLSRFPLSLLALALLGCLARPGFAFDGDRFKVNVSSNISFDDNLTRVPAVVAPPTSDQITTTGVGGEMHLLDGRQNYDATVTAQQADYRRHSSQNYTATNFMLGAGSDVGNYAHVAARLEQSEALTPLAQLQTLVRDVVRTRTAGLTGSYDLDARVRLEASGTRVQSRNDNATLTINDLDTSSGTLGLSYGLPEGSRVGVRLNLTQATYPNTQIPLGGGLYQSYDPRYTDRRVETFGNLSLTPITSLSGTVAAVDHSYGALSGLNSHGIYGSLALDTNSGGPLSYGATLRRDLGGQAILASRVVETEAASVHAAYAYSAVLSAHTSLEFDRNRYSVDLPGFPAHREYETLLSAGLQYTPRRFLTLGLDYALDDRRANPALFGYTDHRLTVSGMFSL